MACKKLEKKLYVSLKMFKIIIFTVILFITVTAFDGLFVGKYKGIDICFEQNKDRKAGCGANNSVEIPTFFTEITVMDTVTIL